METKRTCAGYEIVSTVRVSPVQEIVVGRRDAAPSPYVCWYCLNGDDYFLGRYCETYESALQALAERIGTMAGRIRDPFQKEGAHA